MKEKSENIDVSTCFWKEKHRKDKLGNEIGYLQGIGVGGGDRKHRNREEEVGVGVTLFWVYITHSLLSELYSWFTYSNININKDGRKKIP